MQPIDVFEEVDSTPTSTTVPVVHPQTAQNYISGDPHQDVVIILLDFLNATWSTAARIRAYIGEIATAYKQAGTPITILVLNGNGLRQVQSFTANPENLTNAIGNTNILARQDLQPDASFASPFAPTDFTHTASMLEEARLPGYLDAQRVKPYISEMTRGAIEQIANSYLGIPGRKKLIWMSMGFPGVPTAFPPDSGTALLEFESRRKEVRAWRALSNAGIAVFPIDSNGVINPTWEGHFSADSGPGWRQAPSLERPSNIASLLEAAANTGGANCEWTPSECVQRIQRQDNHYYMLGFYVRGDAKPGWNNIKVHVAVKGATVRARAGFWIGAFDPPSLKSNDKHARSTKLEDSPAQKDEVLTALASPLDYTGVPLRLHWSIVKHDAQQSILELVLNSPPGGVTVDAATHDMNVDWLGFVKLIGKTEGRTVPKSLAARLTPQQEANLVSNGFVFRKQITVAPGRYDLRVLLRDNIAQRIGTVSTTIDIPKE